jgi:hypothetical protein
MTATDVLDLIDRMARETAGAANVMDAAVPGMFDAIGAGKGVAARLQAFEDLRREIVTAGLREHEAADTIATSRVESPPAQDQKDSAA